MAEFIMPSLGADMTAGTLAKWRVAAGDAVAQGDIIAEVETDKGIIEVECWEDATVDELLVEGDWFDGRHFMYYEDMDLGWRARLAGWSLEKIDPIIGQLGEPVSNVATPVSMPSL